jgi:uncharacterized phage protein gp47/JayE
MPTPTTTLTPLQLVTPVLPVGTTVLSVDSSVLPLVVDADTNTVRLEVGIYNTVYDLNIFVLTGVNNQFSTSIPLVPTVQETNVQIIGRNYDPNFIWQANTNYPVGTRYADPNGNVQVVVTAGVTSALQPTWGTLVPATGTSVTIASQVLTITTTTTNIYSVGQKLFLSEFQNATFLNGQVVTITNVVPGTSVTAAFPHADYTTTADAGTLELVTVDNGAVWANIGNIAITPTVKFALLFFQSNLSVAIGPPSGITANKDQTDCTLQWVTPTFPGFIGVRVMISTDPAGVNPPFTQFGDLVTKVTSQSNSTITTSTTTSANVPTALVTNIAIANNLLTVNAANTFVPGTVVQLEGLVNATFLNGKEVTVFNSTPFQFTASFTSQDYTSTPDTGEAISIVSTSTVTQTNTVMSTDFSSVDIPFTFVNSNVFYAMFSTVIQDPQTNALYESVQNGPLKGGFVNLRVVNPTDFPVLQRKEDIAGRLIGQITRQMPDLDLSPRSEIRDLFIDPFSIEVANMSVREWFARVSASISAISQVDDANGDGISDPFQSSQYKQQIARAYGLSATDTQNLIDEQFDILGEQAGLTRGPASASTVVVTFYTFLQPQQSITIPQGAVVGTVGDSTTPSLTFTTLGEGSIDLSNLASFFNPTQGYWAVSVPAQCNQTGSIGNVGAGTIQQIVSGVQTGVNVNNLVGANFGTDEESNSAFAARIQARLVTGIDSSSRNGYLEAALATPGVIAAEVVSAGDLEMLRDWDPTRQKHVFGTVDIYVRGTTLSQQNEFVPFSYLNNGIYASFPTYATLLLLGGMKFQIQNFGSLAFLPYDAVELLVSRASNSFYLSLDRAQFDNQAGTLNLNPNDIAYQYVGNGTTQAKVPLLISNVPATNQAAVAAISGAQGGTYTLQLFARLESPFTHVPALQPVLQVFSVTGSPTGTGSIPSNDISLIHTSDFLLTGGSNKAGDTVEVGLDSQPTTKTLTISPLTSPTLIDLAMDQPLDANGNPLDVLSVRSTDLSTLYLFGIDYNIVPMGPYHQYGIQPLTSTIAITQLQITGNILTVTANNDFGVGALVTFNSIVDPTFAALLNGFSVTIATVTPTSFTASFVNPNLGPTATTGNVVGSAIQNAQQVVVAYNKFILHEILSFIQNEAQILNGTLPTTLSNDGFVRNTWLPQSYSQGVFTFPVPPSVPPFSFNPLALILDGWNGNFGPDGGLDVLGSAVFDPSGLVGAQIPYASRYIKVTFFNGVSNVVMKENIDFTLTVDASSGQATIARILTGKIPDGATVNVSYFTTETFTIATQYPAFVETLANTIGQTQSAAADVLIKAMVANPVDLTLTVTLQANTSPETIDPVIRTVINIALDNAQGTLFQSALIQQIQSITGVKSVEVPLVKCAKSNGSYDIGVVIPTGTSWVRLDADPAFAGLNVPANSWVTANPVLPDSTIPSGGEPTAIVDFLYQGQVFQRASSVEDFLSNAVVVPHLAVNPGVIIATPGSFYIIGDNDSIIPATITATSITNSVLTVTAVNTFSVGQLVELRGTAETFLNGQSVTITSIIKNQSNIQTGFTANFMEGNFTNTTDTGVVGLPQSYAQKVIVTIPADVPNPGNLPYFVTYQVFDEGGAKDVTVSPTEYLAPGRITINYVKG